MSVVALAHWCEHRSEVVVVSEAEQWAADVLVSVAEGAAERTRTLEARAMPKVLVASSLGLRDAMALASSGVVEVIPRASLSDDRLVASVLRAVHRPRTTGRALHSAFQQAIADVSDDSAIATLSSWEITLLRLLADGLSTGEIAGEFGYAERTVANLVHELVRRLGVRNRVHAVAYAIRAGVI